MRRGAGTAAGRAGAGAVGDVALVVRAVEVLAIPASVSELEFHFRHHSEILDLERKGKGDGGVRLT